MHGSLRAVLATVLVMVMGPPAAVAGVPAGADWTEHYIRDSLPYPAGEPTLHADLLVPEGTDLTKAELPIIVDVGPYFGHGGNSPPVSTLEGDVPRTELFADLIEEGELFERGYGLLLVDLRGFGGSQGCNDFGGEGEQNDVRRAIEWAAKQPWSTGKVAAYGHSYDGWTGVMALDEDPQGLAAAVIQSPLIEGYRGLYMDGMHFSSGWYLVPVLDQRRDLGPPSVADVESGRTDYLAGFATGTDPACYATNIALQNGLQKRDDAAGFWRERGLPGARGSSVPTFWSHGFLDVQTMPHNIEPVWSTLEGPARAWFGQFGHSPPYKRGVGRSQYYFDELFAFLDEHLRGAPRAGLPRVEVEDSAGRWRAEDEWPPADAEARAIALRAGVYADRPLDTGGVWSVTPPLTTDAWIAGTPRAQIRIETGLPDANVVARLYDIGLTGDARLISRGAGKSVEAGAHVKDLELFPADYVVPEGHRLGVFVTANDPLFLSPSSVQDVKVAGGTLEAPFLTYARTEFLPGGKSPDAIQRERRAVSSDLISGGATTWEEPPALRPRP